MEVEYFGEGIFLDAVVKTSLISFQSELKGTDRMKKKAESEEEEYFAEHFKIIFSTYRQKEKNNLQSN